MTLLDEILPILPHVSQPIQYVGAEINAVQKPWPDMRVKIGLCFPDVYEVGMSHLGLHLLYDVLNAEPDVVAERLYAPAADMEDLMRVRQIPLFSLESHHAASAFDLLGFTLQYELSYSNILNMLSLAGIPLRSDERNESDPLILAGGPCSANPEPLADVFDIVVIGDGETVTRDLVQAYRDWKDSGTSRQDLFREVCRMPGVYVPSLYDVRYEASGRIAAIVPRASYAPETIQRRIEPDLESLPTISAPIIPYLQPIHDRLTLEIMRGCPRGCRFCQAGFLYRPKRERSMRQLLDVSDLLLHGSGYEEISLSSLSTGDYSQISPLMTALMHRCEAAQVSLSLPSMRASTLTGDMAEIIRRVRKTGFTIAPEAGTQRLRNVINKGISETDILQTAEGAFKAGWDLLKLYFMIGLPTEREEDIHGLIDLVFQIRQAGRRHSRRKVKLHVAVSSFVPKAHTPFQWERMNTIDELTQKQDEIKGRLRHRAAQVKWHNVHESYLEGVFARGDRRLGEVLRHAHALGCRFDGWREHFSFSRWMTAFEQAGINPDEYNHRERDRQEILPWQHIDTGVSSDFLWNERLEAAQERTTAPCSRHCRRCGLCQDDIHVIDAPAASAPAAPGDHEPRSLEELRTKAFRVRGVFSKTGVLRFMSHRDLGRLFQRALVRADVPIAYSQGFHPHPQFSFGPALAVGTEGLREYVDFFLTRPVDVETLIQRMNETLPDGVKLSDGFCIDLKEPSLSSQLHCFTWRVFIPQNLQDHGYTFDDFSRQLEEFHAANEYQVHTFKRRTEPVDIKPYLSSLTLSHNDAGGILLEMEVRQHENIMIKPEEVLHHIFHMPFEHILDCQIVRIDLKAED